MARLAAWAALAAICVLPGPRLAAAAAPAPARAAQLARDPLSPAEADQLRDAAGNPEKRVSLLLGFAQDRLTRFEQSRAGAAPDRQATMYRMLQEFDGILSELDDNLDEWMGGHVTSEMPAKPKLEKPLDAVIAADRGFLAQLAKIQSSSAAADLASYHFELSDVTDDTRQNLQDAQDDAADLAKRKQEAQAAKKKKKHER